MVSKETYKIEMMNYDSWKLMSDRDEMSYANDELYNADVEAYLEYLGATEVDAQVDDKNKTIDIGFADDGVYYYIVDLCQEVYEDMTLKDFISEADESETTCCGARYDIDHRRCFHCKEAF
jgi:hypothetical protein